MTRQEASRPLFGCLRCGIQTLTMPRALCVDCQAVTSDLRERHRWRSDYSRRQRQVMVSLLAPTNQTLIGGPKPVRDQPTRHNPLDLAPPPPKAPPKGRKRPTEPRRPDPGLCQGEPTTWPLDAVQAGHAAWVRGDRDDLAAVCEQEYQRRRAAWRRQREQREDVA